MGYFDNASTTFPKMKKMYKESMDLYEKIGLNFSRNKSEKSKKSLNIKNFLDNNIKKIFQSQHQVIINSSATFSLNEIISGQDYSKIKNIYISPFEHNSVYRVLNKIKNEKNINIEIIKFDNFELDLNAMKLQFMSKNPDMIVITHASNVFGNILPVKTIFEEGKKYSAITILDAAQTGGVIDFTEISGLSNFIVFAGHKNLYGPSGIGGYLIENNTLLDPLLYGGTGINSEDENMPDTLPERFQAGSPNTLGIIGLKLATDELLEIGLENIRNKKMENLKKLYEILEKYDEDIKIHSSRENNIGIISITLYDYSPQEMEKFLLEYGIDVRVGMHCSPLAHKHIGTNKVGTVRLSVGYFNDDKDFQELEKALDKIF